MSNDKLDYNEREHVSNTIGSLHRQLTAANSRIQELRGALADIRSCHSYEGMTMLNMAVAALSKDAEGTPSSVAEE